MVEDINKIETILFTTGKFLNLDEISQLTGVASIGYLKDLLVELKNKYESSNSALQVINENNKWKLGIKKEYLYLTEKLLTTAELDMPVQETLAVIAYKQPAIQADVVNIRGNKSYDHIRRLKEEGFLVSEKFGRTRILKLTNKFYDYFDVLDDQLKEQLVNKSDDKKD